MYRLIFLFVAEDRTLEGQALLHPRDGSESARVARERYAAHYGTARLRELAGKIKGSRHGDLWRQFQILVRALSGEPAFEGTRRSLALPALGSFLWSPGSTAALNDAELTNHDFLEALRHLAFTRQGKVLRPVDYRNLGAEELGGVYESLLALTPQISADGARFTFAEFAGNERKTSGSYYTPDSLVQCLLDSALDPVVEEAIKGKAGAEAEQAILGLKVCDPAVGSGHFLVGAAHRLARHLARVRSQAQGESEPSPLLYQHALRDVIGRCLYGVDLNPMAAELCRVSLWLEALEPGKPLSFLDHHIRIGNSLLGTTPDLIAGGLPDEALTPIEGDDKKACTELKKRNRAERQSLGSLFVAEDAERAEALRSAARAVDEMDDDTPERLARKAQTFAEAQTRYDYVAAKRLADAWCAAFVVRKHFPTLAHNPRFTDAKPFGITQGHLGELAQGRDLPAELAAEVDRLARQYQFFHWHLSFPEVFTRGGFDCLLGNPPWERVSLEEKQWFAAHGREDIANAQTGAIRKRLIEQLQTDDPAVYDAFLDDVRQAEGESTLLRNSGRYPLCGRGRVNLYAVFAEGMRSVLNPSGCMGAVLPTGIATDDTTKLFFQDVVEKNSLRSLFDFENRNELFPGVHREQKFCLFTSGSVKARAVGPTLSPAEFAFFCLDVEDTRHPDKRFFLSPDDIALLNPNTYTCPIFRARRDAELARAIYRRVPVLIREAREGQTEENDWGVSFKQGLFNMTTDSALFQTRKSLEASGWVLEGNVFRKEGITLLPLYEGKLTGIMDHRVGTFEGVPEEEIGRGNEREPSSLDKKLSTFSIIPRWWVDAGLVHISSRDQNESWWLTFHDIANPNNERSFVPTVIAGCAVGNTLPIIELANERSNGGFLAANQSAFCHDYVSRLKISSRHFNFFVVKQLPVVRRDVYASTCGWETEQADLQAWLAPRVLELTYTAWDLEAFAQDHGWHGPPFRWDEDRRFLIRSELDSAYFHLYLSADAHGQWQPARKANGCPHDETPDEVAELKRHFPTPRDAVAYIMDTFPIVRRKDEEKYDGDYRTKRVILEIYDATQEAIRTGQPYQTRLDPPPGPPQDADGKFIPYAQIAANPPPHIHLPRGAVAGGGVTLQLSDLATRFPTEPFLLRLSTRRDAKAQRVRPVRAADIQAADRVVLASAKLRNAGTPVPAAIGNLRVEARTDAGDGSSYVLITVRGEDGTAQARFSEDEWRNLTTLGVVEDRAGS
ncbi:Eco57I restriction-modification methylase domain-containing protein [Accumulibacter sp.]|uniref:Eco57I restriction-modification methylase domain-containing protein n=1 Tax=Accumulibacter sp. TaxID=2053492 RepID=UPI00287B5405|nr:N-6 DNA methylase [Accumulibacter sp.]MDS4054960.1 N-6 DNA methylase [Accumulibacter sp.]